MGRGPEKFDCWGLARHFLKQEFNISLPSYTYGDDPSDAIREGVKDFEPVAAPKAGDLALFSNPLHIGIMLCRDSMLHITRGKDVSVERVGAFRTKRVEGFFRMRDLCEKESV